MLFSTATFLLCFRYDHLSSSLFFFFFLMIRRPPRSTLFPYRRSSDLRRERRPPCARPRPASHWVCRRSEEHTSELQSPCNLVCRLLLEKKKIENIRKKQHNRKERKQIKRII